jgi:hypothetical protein
LFEVFRSGLEWDFLKGKRSGFRVSNMHGKKMQILRWYIDLPVNIFD